MESIEIRKLSPMAVTQIGNALDPDKLNTSNWEVLAYHCCGTTFMDLQSISYRIRKDGRSPTAHVLEKWVTDHGSPNVGNLIKHLHRMKRLDVITTIKDLWNDNTLGNINVPERSYDEASDLDSMCSPQVFFHESPHFSYTTAGMQYHHSNSISITSESSTADSSCSSEHGVCPCERGSPRLSELSVHETASPYLSRPNGLSHVTHQSQHQYPLSKAGQQTGDPSMPFNPHRYPITHPPQLRNSQETKRSNSEMKVSEDVPHCPYNGDNTRSTWSKSHSWPGFPDPSETSHPIPTNHSLPAHPVKASPNVQLNPEIHDVDPYLYDGLGLSSLPKSVERSEGCVFITYVSHAKRIRAIHNELEKNKFTVLSDVKRTVLTTTSQDDLHRMLSAGIRNSDVVLCFLCEEYIKQLEGTSEIEPQKQMNVQFINNLMAEEFCQNNNVNKRFIVFNLTKAVPSKSLPRHLASCPQHTQERFLQHIKQALGDQCSSLVIHKVDTKPKKNRHFKIFKR